MGKYIKRGGSNERIKNKGEARWVVGNVRDDFDDLNNHAANARAAVCAVEYVASVNRQPV